jgi:predicted NAD/FAD-dependent oxidoreductase
MKPFTADQVRLGFIGVGAMGSRIVRRLRDHNYKVTVYGSNGSKPRAGVRQQASQKSDFIKFWLDDFGGQYPKMKPEIYADILDEAHRNGLRVGSPFVPP